ncbi:hypothetical protein HFD88_000149 [Aspergillus terreus]|nr:hypothetical protein HFD88_000149 [Aspergillus terreus]
MLRSKKDQSLVVRKDIEKLDPASLDKLIYAFYKLQKADPGMPPSINEDSFYVIAGYHGQPFRGAGYGNKEWWGGYCHHGNVLFPTWHRAYLSRLEQALQDVSGFSDVALPYWNEYKTEKLPDIFTTESYTFQDSIISEDSFEDKDDITVNDGKITLKHNPLFSYKLQQGFFDNLARLVEGKDESTKRVDYSKYKEYETVRCPYSGLVGPSDRDKTEQHNEREKSDNPIGKLNRNISDWLAKESNTHVPGMTDLYLEAAERAPNYTVFSNTTSAAKWNDDNYGRQENWNSQFAVSLEKPHNGVHLAVGGYSMPDRDTSRPTFEGSNGDMGENDTASFDPIFYFHHCFVDYIFWLWQQKHGAETELAVFEGYPGTSPIDAQGPTAFMGADSQLNMETPLVPFMIPGKNGGREYLKSKDIVNIKESEFCHYDYEPAEKPPTLRLAAADSSAMPIVRLSGISRARRPGSFVVGLYADDGTGHGKKLIGVEPVFSRWQVASCANCSNTLDVTTHIVLTPDQRIPNKPLLSGIRTEERIQSARDLKMSVNIWENQLTGSRTQRYSYISTEPTESNGERLDASIEVLGGMRTV